MSETQSRLESRSSIRSTCDSCLESKVRCGREQPACRRCRKHGRRCVYSFKRRLGRPRRSTNKSANPKGQNGASSFVDTGHEELEVSQADALTFTEDPFSTTSTSADPPSSAPPSHMNVASELSIEALLFEDQQIHGPTPPLDTNLSLPSWLSGFGKDSSLSFADDTVQSLTFADDFILSGGEPTSSTTAFSNGGGPTSRIDTSLPDVMNDGDITQHHDGQLGPQLPDNRLHLHEADHTVTSWSFSSGETYSGTQPRTEDLSDKLGDRGSSIAVGCDDNAPCPSGLTTQCHCYVDILRRLLQLKEEQFGVQSKTIEQIMKLEKDVRIQALTVTSCKFCSLERPKVLLLVGIVLEHMLDILECIPLNEESCSAQTSEPREMDMRRDSALTRPDSAIDIPLATMKSTVLQFGGYEICGQEKLSFVRHIFQARLRELSLLTNECLQQCKAQPSNFKAAATMTLELEKRFHTVMNRFEA